MFFGFSNVTLLMAVPSFVPPVLSHFSSRVHTMLVKPTTKKKSRSILCGSLYALKPRIRAVNACDNSLLWISGHVGLLRVEFDEDEELENLITPTEGGNVGYVTVAIGLHSLIPK